MKSLTHCLFLLILLAFQLHAAEFRHADIHLPQNSVLHMLEDRKGFLWFATGAGLAKYDGYQVQTFLHQPGVDNSLSQNLVLYLLEDADGSMWVATNNGINRYRPEQGFQRYLYHPGSIERDVSHRINLIYRDPDGGIWAGAKAGLYRYNPQTDQFLAVTFPAGLKSHQVDKISWQDNSLWLAGTFGLARLTKSQLSAPKPQAELLYGAHPVADWFHDSQQRLRLSISLGPANYHSSAVVQFSGALPDQQPELFNDLKIIFFHCDRLSRCWGSGAETLYRLLPDGQFKLYPFAGHSPFNTFLFETASGELLVSAGNAIYRYVAGQDLFVPMSIEQTQLQSTKWQFYDSSDGSVWVSSNIDGLFHWAPSRQKFQTILPPDTARPDANVIRVVREDLQGKNLWLASDNGQLFSTQLSADHRQTLQNWSSYKLPGAEISRIHSLHPLQAQQFLLGTTRGLMLGQLGQSNLTPAPLQALLPGNNGAQKNYLAEQPTQVLDMLSDERCLWLATTAGLGCADLSGRTVRHWYDAGKFPAFADNYLYRIYQARDGALWLSSTRGLIRFDPQTATLEHFLSDQNNPNSLSHDWVHGIWQSSADEFWVATREGGLNRLHYRPDKAPGWQRFGMAQGLPTEVLYTVFGDSSGLLWLSSNQGIFSFNPKTLQARQYHPEDGLQSTEFNFSVGSIGASGRIYFGGVAGANSFIPAQIRDNPVVPRTLLAGLRVNELPVDLPLQTNQHLSLKHNQNQLVFDVLALQYANPNRNQYAWQLKGADPDWVYAGNNRQARYAALPSGTYQFWFKAANPDGLWSEPKLMLTLVIQPHPLLSYPAIALYLLLLVAILWGYKRWRDKTELQLQHKIQQGISRETALNKSLRIQFEHTAHEMRTPLMRLQTHLQRSLTALQRQQPQEAAASLQTADAAQQELQLLIGRQLAVEELKLQQSGQPLHLAARPVILAELLRYQRYAAEKGLQLTHSLADATVLAVPGVLELICDNLLSNAIKYTPAGGLIQVGLTVSPPWLELKVTDNGPGIAVDEQQKVFLRHYRVAGQQHISGSGEGLFLVKHCVEDAGGEINLQSQPGTGSIFSVRLPLGQDNCRQIQPAPTEIYRSWQPQPDVRPSGPFQLRPADQPETILLVEDHPGLLQDLHSLLHCRYRCLLADKSQQGLELAQRHLPDLVISDVMMEQPDSGFTLLEALKSHTETSHIPVLLLTALHDEKNRLRGLHCQADAYLSKPVGEQTILATVESMLNQRWRLCEHIRRALLNASEQSAPLTAAGRFQAKLQGIFAVLYQNPDTQVQDIAEAFGKSASALQKIARQYSACSLKESLRDYRLQKAKELLQHSGALPIEQIAEQCGFGSTRSLQRDFKACFKLTPQQYRDGQRPLQRPAIMQPEDC